MKHYINSKNEIYGFESDGSQDHLITADMQPISKAEIAERNKPTAEQLAAKIPSIRKSEEDKGVTINNVRYSGSEKNRTALQEAINYLKDSGGTTFPVWKDSDHVYHQNHPLKDVEDALRAIGVRRMALIARESEHVKAVMDGVIDNVDNLDWSV